MIASLRGMIVAKHDAFAVIEAGGVGYEVFFCDSTLRALGAEGTDTFILVAESISMYGGTALYGFLNKEEKGLFDLFRDAVPNTGAKKALDYLNKALKSLPDFKHAVVANDSKLLTSIFGFTSKTADKLIAALKDKMPDFQTAGSARLAAFSAHGVCARVLTALATLGFKPGEAKAALEAALAENASADNAEELLKRALKSLSPG